MVLTPEIRDFLGELKNRGVRTAIPELSEEEQSFPTTFAEERGYAAVEVESWDPVKVKPDVVEFAFPAFLDGVQRTIMLPYRVPLPSGAQVPVHVAHIAAGIIFRDESGRLYVDPDYVAARLLLLGPFHGIREAGGLSIPEGEFIWDTSDQTFNFPSSHHEWIVCDTTFRGTEEDRKERSEGALVGPELFKEGEIRSRAQGRVAVLRQRLEFAVLAKFRQRHPDAFILVDGPLFFLSKWRRKALNVLGSFINEYNEYRFEEKLLKNAVGLIKTHRLRPRHPEKILTIKLGERSPVFRIQQEVDIKGRRGEPDEEGGYDTAHFIWYTRIHSLNEVEVAHGFYGLVRIDVHRSTFGIEWVEAIDFEKFRDYKETVDRITKAVWRERWPVVYRETRGGFGTQIYPIEQLEKFLKSWMYPKRLLSSICSS